MADDHGRDLDDPVGQIRAYYEAVDAGDVDAMMSLFAEDAVYERPGQPPFEGRAAIEAFYRTGSAVARGTHTLRAVVVDLPHVAVHGEFVGSVPGAPAFLRFAEFFRLSGDGLIARRDTFFFTSPS